MKGYVIPKPLQESDAYKVRVQCLAYGDTFVRLEDGDPRRIQVVGLDSGDGVYTFLFDESSSLHAQRTRLHHELRPERIL